MTERTVAPGLTALRATEPAELSADFADDPGAVTVTVARDDGTLVVDAAPAVGSGTVRTYDLTPTDTALPDLLTASWAGTVGGVAALLVTRYEIVGDFLFGLAEARAFDGGKLGSVAAYPDEALADARDRIATWFAAICGVDFFPRYRRLVLDGDGTSELLVPDLRVTTLRAARLRQPGGATWAAFGPEDVAATQVVPFGLLVRESGGIWTRGRRTVEVAYEHGHADVPPAIRYAGLKVLTNQVIPSNLSDRSIQQSTQFGLIQLATPNPNVYGRWFGIPVADSALASYASGAPGVG